LSCNAFAIARFLVFTIMVIAVESLTVHCVIGQLFSGHQLKKQLSRGWPKTRAPGYAYEAMSPLVRHNSQFTHSTSSVSAILCSITTSLFHYSRLKTDLRGGSRGVGWVWTNAPTPSETKKFEAILLGRGLNLVR